jgi:hypothetical protein
VLPQGCKDLLDVLKLAQKAEQNATVRLPILPSATFEDFKAEFDHLVRFDQEWRDYFANQRA